MNKSSAFTLNEIAVIGLLILITAFLIIPNLIEDDSKLEVISSWKNSYKNMEYIFSAIQAQASKKDNAVFLKAKSDEEKEKALADMLAPYLRFEKAVSIEDYSPKYMNGKKINIKDEVYITNFHLTASGKIVGVKWLNTPHLVTDNLPIAIISVDLNGFDKPNRWGYDVFGLNLYTNKIEPIGKTNDDFLLKLDCSSSGMGLTCSYFYYNYGGQLN